MGRFSRDEMEAAGTGDILFVNGALGGSTNAVIHLLAMAGRIGVPLTLEDWDRFGRDVVADFVAEYAAGYHRGTARPGQDRLRSFQQGRFQERPAHPESLGDIQRPDRRSSRLT